MTPAASIMVMLARRTIATNGPGTMEAIYFGNNNYWGSGGGAGPWVMADLEDGLF